MDSNSRPSFGESFDTLLEGNRRQLESLYDGSGIGSTESARNREPAAGTLPVLAAQPRGGILRFGGGHGPVIHHASTIPGCAPLRFGLALARMRVRAFAMSVGLSNGIVGRSKWVPFQTPSKCSLAKSLQVPARSAPGRCAELYTTA